MLENALINHLFIKEEDFFFILYTVKRETYLII